MGLLDLPKDCDTVQIRKQLTGILRNAQEKSKPTTCILCGKQITGLCNSHSVPQLVLRNLACNGMITQSNFLVGIEPIDVDKGIKSSGTFHFICRDCDSRYFHDYEDNNNLMSFPSDKVLSEIALKNALLQLSKRKTEIEIYKELEQMGSFLCLDTLEKCKLLDVKEYTKEIQRYKRIVDSDAKGRFEIIFWKLLPYKTPIAVQTEFALNTNLKNNIVNDVFDYSESVRMQNMHLCVFPLENSTAIIAFYHKRDYKYSSIQKQVAELQDDAALMYLNWLVFKYSENYFFSPSVKSIIETDNNLQRLSQDSNGFSSLGIGDIFELFGDIKPVSMHDIPNLLSQEYATNVNGLSSNT